MFQILKEMIFQFVFRIKEYYFRIRQKSVKISEVKRILKKMGKKTPTWDGTWLSFSLMRGLLRTTTLHHYHVQIPSNCIIISIKLRHFWIIDYFQILMSVRVLRATMAVHVLMVSIGTHAHVDLVSQGRVAKLVSCFNLTYLYFIGIL